MTDTIDGLDAQIRTLQEQAAAVAAAPQSFDEAWPSTEQALHDCEDVFRHYGPQLGSTFVFPEAAYRRHQAAIGAAVVAGRKQLIELGKARLRAATEGGISAADKPQQIAELERAILRLAAKRELLVRATEADGEFKPRPPLHAELAVFRQDSVAQLAR